MDALKGDNDFSKFVVQGFKCQLLRVFTYKEKNE